MNNRVKMLILFMVIILGVPFIMAPTLIDDRATTPGGFTFKVDIPGAVVGYFTEASGMGTTQEVVEQKITDAYGRTQTIKVPGRLSVNPIAVKRALTANMDLWNWRQMVVESGKGFKKNGSIIMYDSTYTPVAQWNLVNAWPSQITYNNGTDTNGIYTESAVIVCEGIIRVK